MTPSTEQTKELLSHHRKNLSQSGLTDETIKAAKIYSATREEAKRLLGFDPQSDGWFAPYPSEPNFPVLLIFKPDIPFIGHRPLVKTMHFSARL